MNIPGPAYRIQTARLIIRCWNPVDAPLLKAAVDENKEHLLPWLPWARTIPEDLQIIIDRLRFWRGEFDLSKDFVYGIFNHDESRVLGGCGLHTRQIRNTLEIGYWIHKDYINQGLATEASAALTKVAFRVNRVHRMEIHCKSDNLRSAAVPKKLGYTLEAVMRQYSEMEDGAFYDTMIWTLLEGEFSSSPSAQIEIEAYDCAGRSIL